MEIDLDLMCANVNEQTYLDLDLGKPYGAFNMYG